MNHPLNKLDPDNWINNYSDVLYSYAFMRINNQEAAEDIVQDTFLSAWKAKDAYKGEASEKNWLYAILKNKIIDHYRKKAVVVDKVSNDEALYFDGEEHWTEESAPLNWPIESSNPLRTKEFFKVLKQCKSKLKDLQRRVFILKYMEDLDAEDICKELDITSSNYWVLIHRAKLHLRSCLEKNWINV